MKKIPRELTLLMISDIIKIRENKTQVGNFKFNPPSIGNIIGGILTYEGEVIKIKNKLSTKGEVLEFKNKNYQMMDNEIKELPSKKKLIKVKIRENRIHLETPEKELILKVKFINDIVKFEFLKDPDDLALFIIAGIYYFFKIIILSNMGKLEVSENTT